MGKSKNFIEQLIDFDNDTSYFKDYDYREIKKEGQVLIRFFKYSAQLSGNKSSIIIPDKSLKIPGVIGNNNKTSEVLKDRVTEIGKVIKSTSKKHKEGDLVVVSRNKVEGEDYTPEYFLILQMSQSNLPPITPPNYKETASRLEINFADYRVSHPWNEKLTEEDWLTYLLPEFEFIDSLDLSKVSKEVLNG